MAKRDLDHLLAVPVKSIDVGAKTDGTVNGTSADMKGYHSCIALIDADAWTDGTHTLSLEDSADNSTFAAVSGGASVVIDGAADDDQAYKIAYNGHKRYVRVVAVTASSSTGAIVGASLVRGHKAAKGKLNQ